MPKARIIGIGSPFGDDSLGLRAIDLIERSGMLLDYPPGRVELMRLDRPGPALVHRLRDLELAVLIDAMRSGAPAGTVRELAPAELEVLVKPVSSHGFDLGATLHLARALGALPRHLRVLGIEMARPPESDPRQAAGLPDQALRRPLLRAVRRALGLLQAEPPARLEA